MNRRKFFAFLGIATVATPVIAKEVTASVAAGASVREGTDFISSARISELSTEALSYNCITSRWIDPEFEKLRDDYRNRGLSDPEPSQMVILNKGDDGFIYGPENECENPVFAMLYDGRPVMKMWWNR